MNLRDFLYSVNTATNRVERVRRDRRERKILKRLFIAAAVIWFIISMWAISSQVDLLMSDYRLRSPIQSPFVEKEKPQPKPTQKPVEKKVSLTPQAHASQNESVLYRGKISHYSHAGCLGCSEGQIMGNGEAFNEMAMTLAVPCEDILSGRISYNTYVKVTNLDNGLSVEGRITDCGGFSKYNRIADLSLGMGIELGTKTDVSNVLIELL